MTKRAQDGSFAGHHTMIDRLTRQMSAKGVPNARAEAVTHLQNCGVLRKGTETLTAKGRERTHMGPSGRAKDRAARQSGDHKPEDYKYNRAANRAVLK
jgi:hypothetical protein